MLHPRCEILLSLYITEWFHGPVWHYFKHNLCTIKNFFLYVTIQACKTVLISWTYSCLLIKCLCSNSYNYLQPWGSGLTLLCLFTTNQIKENAGWDSCKITVLLLSPLVQLFISKIGLLHRPVTLATKLNPHIVSLVLVKETIVREDYRSILAYVHRDQVWKYCSQKEVLKFHFQDFKTNSLLHPVICKQRETYKFQLDLVNFPAIPICSSPYWYFTFTVKFNCLDWSN